MKYPYKLLAIAPIRHRATLDALHAWDDANDGYICSEQEWEKDGEKFCIAATKGNEWFVKNYIRAKGGAPVALLLSPVGLSALRSAASDALDVATIIIWQDGDAVFPADETTNNAAEYLAANGYKRV